MTRKKFRRKIYKAKKKFMKRRDTTPAYRAFRKAVMDRDNSECAMCAFKSPRNEVHHIVKWANNHGARYLVNNGITLCHKCHKKIGGKEEQYARFFCQIVAQRNANDRSEEVDDFHQVDEMSDEDE
jgi:5-methylcytosine-specific restriction endonuclease McrA